MKKILLLAAFFITGLSAAQSDPRFTIGSKAGFGHSFVAPYGGGFNGSWLVGLTTNYMTGEHLGFGADILYSSEGGRIELIDGSATTSEIDYLRVPVRILYAMGASDAKLRPRIAAGPTFGVNMAEGTGYQDFDFGVNASAGLNYRLVEGLWLGLDAAYYHGLMDIYGANSVTERNGNLRLELSITFGL